MTLTDAPWAHVPAGWELQPLLAVASEGQVRNTGMAETNLLSLSYGRIVRRNIETLDGLLPASFETYQVVEPGDVVCRFTDLQNDKRSLRTALVTERGIITSAYTALKPRCLPRWMSYLLRAYDYQKVFYGFGGGVRQSLKFADVKRLPVLLPPEPEQRAIADFLDRETAQIDAMVDAQERLVALLEERRSAVVTAAVTEGLRRAPLAETGNRWLPLLPRGWDLVQFRRVVKVVNGLVDPTEPPYANMVLIAPNHVEKGTGRVLALETAAEQHAESGKYIVRSGQVIYSKIRPALNKVALATQDCLCSADMYALDSDSRQMTNQFLAYYLRARPFHAFASEMSMRVAMPKVNREEIASGPIAVPPLAEQAEITDYLDNATARIDAMNAKAQRSIALMKERREAVISAAVTGRIDVLTGIEQVERDLEEARV